MGDTLYHHVTTTMHNFQLLHRHVTFSKRMAQIWNRWAFVRFSLDTLQDGSPLKHMSSQNGRFQYVPILLLHLLE